MEDCGTGFNICSLVGCSILNNEIKKVQFGGLDFEYIFPSASQMQDKTIQRLCKRCGPVREYRYRESHRIKINSVCYL